MIMRDELLAYCDELLHAGACQDYCPNGLQVEGLGEVRSIVAGVTASRALLEAAVARRADTILVHHGYFWRGENPVIQGMKRTRLALLLAHNINLIAYHLPLDVHPEYGNNVGLGRALGFSGARAVEDFPESGLLWQETLVQPISPAALATRIARALRREPLHIAGGGARIRHIMWCTGGAQSLLEAAAERRADAFISGEISEQTVHTARENGVHFYAAGHHATERSGVRALAAHLAEKFSLEAEFIDLPNPA